MEKEITPKKTILLLTILFSIASYFALDHHYKTRAKDVILTIVNSSGELIKVNNFMQFGSTIKFVMSREPFIKTIILFDKDFRKLLSFGNEIDIATEFHHFNNDRVQFLHSGLLDYTIKYTFDNDADIIMVAVLNDDNRLITLVVMTTLIFLLFGVIYLVCQRLDIDNLNARAAKHALDLMNCGFHEMKQTVELFRILQEQIKNKDVNFKDPAYAKMFISDFDKNMITVDSMMSILKLTNKNSNIESDVAVDFKEIVQACINSYKNDKKSIDIKFDHTAKLHFSKDILYATVGNLIKNAYTYSDGLIWIRTYEEDKRLVFSIANTGKAIPKEKQKVILKPGIALKGQTGLGLHICDTWCRKIGAKLNLESHHAATQFSIAFPLSSELKPKAKLLPINFESHSFESNNPTALHGEEDSSVAEAMLPLENNVFPLEQLDKRVAVIDDIKTFRVSLCRQFKLLGYQADHYENMDVFLDTLKHDPWKFQYILIDRHGDGFDAVKDRFPDSCRYYGYKGKIILYSSDLPNISGPEWQSKGFDYAVKKGQQVDWRGYFR